jgi:hypothetical protein
MAPTGTGMLSAPQTSQPVAVMHLICGGWQVTLSSLVLSLTHLSRPLSESQSSSLLQCSSGGASSGPVWPQFPPLSAQPVFFNFATLIATEYGPCCSGHCGFDHCCFQSHCLDIFICKYFQPHFPPEHRDVLEPQRTAEPCMRHLCWST